MLQINDLNIPMHPKNQCSDNYAAQGVLIAYYNQDYLIPIETNQGISYRSKSDQTETDLDKGRLIFNPTLIDDHVKVSIQVYKTSREVNLIIYSAEGKQLYQAKINSLSADMNINTSDWPTGVFFGTLSTLDGVIANNRSIKK